MTGMATKSKDATVTLTDEQIDYLDRQRAELEAQHQGVHVSRSAVLRRLIEEARSRGGK
jgi:hypothetical protein